MPPELIDTHAHLDDERFATAECTASVAGRAVAQAKLFFSFVPLESFAAGFKDQVLDDFISESAR